ncbi:dihydroneopterin aldolase [Prosthecochloris marina]|uniref:7,8-dihydroneopterin aldolase n=1 Tax=Prosthecochloris marina TaxID=2017681 RepID=A0A317T7J4_9CHLB|nr:dihydroneopterin aldolase [Prosthecochloris marina]PWW82719.1 dihydroneopterin aldolase [Prosthecochloris marina]
MKNDSSATCVKLVNLTFYAHHGVYKEEHFVGSKYEVDAEMYFNFSQAAQRDDITSTIDYRIVYEKIKSVLTQKKFFLIEAVAYTIAMGFLDDFPLLDRVTIKVRKRNPPIGGVCDYAEAAYTAKKS